jgi:quercetin dioxygenase-like cupin family protein
MAQVVSTQEREFSPLSPTKKAILNQEGLRSILFCLKEGQRIPLHTSPYRVITLVLSGRGMFFLGSEENFVELKGGDYVLYERQEPHGFYALEDMVVLAFVF